MKYWGVVMYGINDAELNWKDEWDGGLFQITEDIDNREVLIKLPNKKNVLLNIEITEDDNYIGFYACYPWDEHGKGLEEKDIEAALIQFLTPYVKDTEKEIRNKTDYISTYNCC